MSSNIKHVIDTGLGSLYASERDVQTILRRARTEESARTKKPTPVRFTAVIAAVMVMILAGAAWTVADRIGGQERSTPLSGQEGDPLPCISKEAAIALAEAEIRRVYGSGINLRDPAQHRIDCELHAPDLHAGQAHYRVTFTALTIEGTDYTVDVLAAEGTEAPILSCTRMRGVGEWHTPAEMRHGYSRLYGTDLTKWPAAILNQYRNFMRSCDSSAKFLADRLIRQGDYLDPTAAALPQEAAQADSAILMKVGGRTIWKLAIPLDPTGDGLRWVRLLEKDATTGDVLSDIRVDESNVGFLPLIATETIRDNFQEETAGSRPDLPRDKARAQAESWIAAHYGETRDLTDTALYTFSGNMPHVGYPIESVLRYTAVNPADPSYWVALDFHGVVLDSGRYTARTDGLEDLDSIRFQTILASEIYQDLFRIAEDYKAEDVIALQEALRERGDRSDPIARLLMDAQYGVPRSDDDATTIASRALNIKTMRIMADVSSFCIRKGDQRILKAVLDTDRGIYIVEVDAEKKQMTHAVRVENLRDCWWAPFLLQEDMEAAGIAPIPYTLPENDGRTAIDAPYVPTTGMRIDYLNTYFRQIYTPDFADWTQAQLRTYQQYAIVSDGIDGDMGIYALRRTWYPDVPANAISREEAAQQAIAHLRLTGYESDGAVLIGTKGNPVWKVCLHHESEPCWYAEVDCMTGEVLTVKQRQDDHATPLPAYPSEGLPEYWYRDIVLEETIRECEEDWIRRSNG